MSSSNDEMPNYHTLRQNLYEVMPVPSAPSFDLIPGRENTADNINYVSPKPEMLQQYNIPQLDDRKKIILEAEIKKAMMKREHLMREKQIMEEEFKAKEMMLKAEIEQQFLSLLRSAENPGMNSSLFNGVLVDNQKADSSSNQKQVFSKPNLNETSRIGKPSPTPIGLDQLSKLDSVSIRQLESSSLDEAFEVVAPGGVVILRANLSFDLIGGSLTKKVISLDMFDSGVNELITLRPGHSQYLELNVGGQRACYIRKKPTVVKPMLMLYDPGAVPVLKIKGPSIGSNRLVFVVQTLEKHNIGSIDKSPARLPAGYVDSNHTALTFPRDLNVKFKAAIIASSFLIVSSEIAEKRDRKLGEAYVKNNIQYPKHE